MRGTVAKKCRQQKRRNWRDFYEDIMKQPFKIRFRIAWYIVTHGRKHK